MITTDQPLVPGSIVTLTNHVGRTRSWRVSGVYYGALDQEDLVGLDMGDRSLGTAHGQNIEEYMVPLDLLRAAATLDWVPRERPRATTTLEHNPPGSVPVWSKPGLHGKPEQA